MYNELIDFLNKANNFEVWAYLRKNYEGNFDSENFDMFDKYAYFYDIRHEVMNVIIFFGMDQYDLNSSKLVRDLHDICKIYQKNKVETAREAVYLTLLLDINLTNKHILQELKNQIMELDMM